MVQGLHSMLSKGNGESYEKVRWSYDSGLVTRLHCARHQ
jgi:hypothetical protein